MINILTDSCVDLSPDLLSKFQIGVVPLSVFINNRLYSDGIDINLMNLFELVSKTGPLPKTSAPSVADFLRFFDRNGPVIYIGISSKLSATIQNATLAKQILGGRDIRIIDSLNLSTGIGLLVLKAVEMRDRGMDIDTIEKTILEIRKNVCTSFVIDTLDYLYMGGRCSAMQHLAGSLLKIRPIIEVRHDGTLGVREKITGSRKKALNSLLMQYKNNLPKIDRHRIFVTHTGCDVDAEFIVNELRNLASVENLHTTFAGSTIASHCGPNTIGILYLTN